jgi:hypothetical protein
MKAPNATLPTIHFCSEVCLMPLLAMGLLSADSGEGKMGLLSQDRPIIG